MDESTGYLTRDARLASLSVVSQTEEQNEEEKQRNRKTENDLGRGSNTNLPDDAVGDDYHSKTE